MKKIDHCQLCEHQKIDFMTGSYCAITNSKPEFVNTCINANFDSKLALVIEDVNIEYEIIRKQKKVSIYKVIFIVYSWLSLSFLWMLFGQFHCGA